MRYGNRSIGPTRAETAAVTRIAQEYPEPLYRHAAGFYYPVLAEPEAYAVRVAFDVGLVTAQIDSGGTVVDVGGGAGLFAIALARRGYQTILMDDFHEHTRHPDGRLLLEHLRAAGIELRARDVLGDGLGLLPESVEAVTAFHVLEHMHGSPRGWFREAIAALKPGGLFVLAGPNAANLRKRVMLPLGKSNWSPMRDWYEEPVFRGHVREPVVGDLKAIAADIGLEDVRVIGRNFLGVKSPRRWIRWGSVIADAPLRWRASLCSDLYMMGRKPG